MLGKLLKYELKSTVRVFIPLYIGIILALLVTAIFFSTEFEVGIALASLVLFALFVALAVMTILQIIQRFNKNLLSDEGYLMFTLPVKSEALILSKIIVALIWTVISCIVAFISFCAIFLITAPVTFNEIQRAFLELLSIINTYNLAGFISIFMLCAVFSYIIFIMLVYTALSIGQLPVFNKYRTTSSVVAFLVIYVLIQIITLVLTTFTPEIMQNNSFDIENISYMTAIMGAFCCVQLVYISALFFTTNHLLKKKLNLE